MTQAGGEPSEYGGYAGSIQPEPHELTSIEKARLIRRTNPSDASDTVDAARDRELRGEGNPT
jgi:hypothetical protein